MEVFPGPEDQFKHVFEIVNGRDLEALGDGLAEEAELYFPKTHPLRGRNRLTKSVTSPGTRANPSL